MRLWEESGRGSGCGEDGRGRTRSVFSLGMSILCWPVQAPVARAGSSGPCFYPLLPGSAHATMRRKEQLQSCSHLNRSKGNLCCMVPHPFAPPFCLIMCFSTRVKTTLWWCVQCEVIVHCILSLRLSHWCCSVEYSVSVGSVACWVAGWAGAGMGTS